MFKQYLKEWSVPNIRPKLLCDALYVFTLYNPYK